MEQEKPKNSPKFYCEPCRYGTDSKSCYERHLKTTLHITGKRKERSDKIAYQCESPGCDYMSHNNLNYFVHILNCHSTREERAKVINTIVRSVILECSSKLPMIIIWKPTNTN